MDKLFLPNDHVNKYKGPPLPRSVTVLVQLASGLEYIHSQNIVHRDIKPENILLSVKTPLNECSLAVTFKWADFGLSKSNVTDRGTFSQSAAGSLKWMAPEVFGLFISNLEENQPVRGTLKSDVYSEGLVFGYYLLDGEHILGQNCNALTANSRQTIIIENATSKINKSTYVVRKISIIKVLFFFDIC